MAAMITVGLVLSAGGMSGAAHHAGALAGLAEATGWDPRRADVIVGTSAGSSTAVTLRAGLSAPDHAAYYTHRPLSPEGQTLADRVTTRLDLPDPPASEHRRPANPLLIARGLFGRGRPRPIVALAGALPEGTVDGSSLAARAAESHPGPWPDLPTWICAVDLDSGRRTVFGRDDVDAPFGLAVQASSAIPGYFRPVDIGSRRFVDGGIHSSTNADLVAGLGLDLVVVCSSMTATRDASGWPGSPLSRAWHSRTLFREVQAIRARGTKVLVLQPTAADIDRRSDTDMDPATTDVCDAARLTAMARLAHPESAGARTVLEQAAAPAVEDPAS